jgi:hypothetical protein
MKISSNTINLLQSFSQISSNLLVKPGNKMAIRNGPVNSIQARANVEEQFPVQFAIYDLNQLLSLLSVSNDPDIQFGEKSMIIRSGNGGEIEYFYADPTLVTAPSENSPQLEDVFTFDMSSNDITTIIKTASIVSATMLSIEAKNGTVTLSINDPKNNTSHSFRKVVGTSDLTFNAKMSIDSFKVVPDSYKVRIANAIAKSGKVLVFFFESTTRSLTYLIAADTSSKV